VHYLRLALDLLKGTNNAVLFATHVVS